MTYRPLPVRPRLRATQACSTGRRVTLAGLLLVAFGVALIGAGPALADRIEDKRAEAQSVLGQIQQLDSSLEQAIEAYNLANVQLTRIKHDLSSNTDALVVARRA